MESVFPTVRNGGIFNTSSLDLQFARTKTLDPRITFTRASSGTYVGSDGLIKTATTNLLLRSEELSNATWAKDFTVATADQATAPNGTLTADKVAEDSTTNFHAISQYVSGFASGAVASLSIYAKAAGRTKFRIQTDSTGGSGTADFDLSAVTATSGTGVFSAGSIQAVGDGWYRCSVRCTTSGAGAIGLKVILAATTYGTSYAGDGTSGLFLWGAQLEQSSTVGEYIPTTSTINSAPRFDHNPTTGESLGLLVEEQRTNLLTASEAMHTSPWGLAAATAVANDGVAPDGTTTADKVISTGGGVFRAGVGVANSTAYTYSVFLKHVAGTGVVSAVGFERFGSTPLAGTSSFNLLTGAIVNGAAVQSSSITRYPNNWYRVSVTATSTDVTTTVVNYAAASGNEFLIWGAQLETGAFPTSYIPTTTATVTRSADVASITGANFSSWYRQDEGTVFAEVALNGRRASSPFVQFEDATAGDRIQLRQSADAANVFAQATDGASASPGIASTAFAVGTNFKIAFATKASDYAASIGGATASASSTLTTIPTVDRLTFSSSFNPPAAGTIRRLTYWPSRLANNVLQEITR
jgi:hypothetical protein